MTAPSEPCDGPSEPANAPVSGQCPSAGTTAGYGESIVTGPANRALCPVSGRCVGEVPPRGAKRMWGVRGVAPLPRAARAARYAGSTAVPGEIPGDGVR